MSDIIDDEENDMVSHELKRWAAPPMTPQEAQYVAAALQYAVATFGDRIDKSGRPQILHSLRVGLAGTSPAAMAAGFLHAIIEDTRHDLVPVTLEQLQKDVGDLLPGEVFTVVQAVTNRQGEKYREFIQRIIRTGPLAIEVKLNDVGDNIVRCLELSKPEADSLFLRYVTARLELKRAQDRLTCRT